VEPSTGIALDERQIEELDRIIYTGEPRIWCDYGANTVLKPTPDGVYTFTHRYVKKETPLASGGDLPAVPPNFDTGIVEWATMLSFRFTRQYDKADEAADAYNNWLTATVDIVRRSRRPIRVQVRPGSPY
jgi:hypothetical protein